MTMRSDCGIRLMMQTVSSAAVFGWPRKHGFSCRKAPPLSLGAREDGAMCAPSSLA